MLASSMLLAAVLLGSAIGILKSLIFVVFMFVGLLMCLIVLLQEPKGGGLSGAFGGVGAETFGVQTGGVNKFTSVLAGVFLCLAIMYAAIREPEPPSIVEKSLTETQEPIGDGITGTDGGEESTPPADKPPEDE